VDRHAVEGRRAGEGRANSHLRQRHAGAFGGILETGAVPVEVFDQPVHQILGVAMRQVFDKGGHIDHRLACKHAKPEIVEIKELHVFPLWMRQTSSAIFGQVRAAWGVHRREATAMPADLAESSHSASGKRLIDKKIDHRAQGPLR
jgi:hypothetical protein